MAAGAVWHLPASTRSIRLGDGNVITIDVLCRKCGFEQVPDWKGLRCQNCKHVLDQLGSLLTNHQFRAVGWHTSYKKKKMREEKERRKKLGLIDAKSTQHTQYGTGYGRGQVYGFSGTSIRSLVQQAQDSNTNKQEEEVVQVNKTKRKKPSIRDLRHETNDIIGNWVCAIDSTTGDDYFYNKKTKAVTWNTPRALIGFL